MQAPLSHSTGRGRISRFVAGDLVLYVLDGRVRLGKIRGDAVEGEMGFRPSRYDEVMAQQITAGMDVRVKQAGAWRHAKAQALHEGRWVCDVDADDGGNAQRVFTHRQ